MRDHDIIPLRTMSLPNGIVDFPSLPVLAARLDVELARLPYTIRVFMANLAQLVLAGRADLEQLHALARWQPAARPAGGFSFLPHRVVLQDFTGIPAIADLAAMRDVVAALGHDPAIVDFQVPADQIIDHSLRVDAFGHPEAAAENATAEYQRNAERYSFLRWAQHTFAGLRVVPPGAGIVHQINLERLASVVAITTTATGHRVSLETVVGTDSHTTMINGLGVLGWGVGGIEAEAVLLGEPIHVVTPRVVGVRLTGRLRPKVTATDLALTITALLRRHDVTGAFVEYFGPGVGQLQVPVRATLANMAPEYGATTGFFPVDREVPRYLAATGRGPQQVELVERYCREQGLFRGDEDPTPNYSDLVELDLATVEPSVAGPRRPHDRHALSAVPGSFAAAHPTARPPERPWPVTRPVSDGDIAIAAITSCTNTSNPAGMLAAGLLAKKAVERGLTPPRWVKTSLAPGSRVVVSHLERAGLLDSLERLGFAVVGYGCTTCHGMSGPLVPEVDEAVHVHDVIVTSVTSGNRNFEGRVHLRVRASYLASPPLVVAYALAGSVAVDLAREPVGYGADGRPVSLAELWPSEWELQQACQHAGCSEAFTAAYAGLFAGDERWAALPLSETTRYPWRADSTYIRRPPYLDGFTRQPTPLTDIRGARALVVLGDGISTDHISPVGSITADSPAGRYLRASGLTAADFNSFGTRRGNHEVMVRGTFGNLRLRNSLTPELEGPWTRVFPSHEVTSVYDAAMDYRRRGIPTVVIAGSGYGCGSSRDWAAKGTAMLGVRAVLADSFERIHRSNLVGMGVLPLQFAGADRGGHGLTGEEEFEITGLCDLVPGGTVNMIVTSPDGTQRHIPMLARVDSPTEFEYYRHRGLLGYVLRRLLERAGEIS